MSPARRAATVEDAVTEPGPSEEPAKVDHETLIGAIKEVLGELGITGGAHTEPGEGTNEIEESEADAEEMETPRQAEHRMRKEIESAVQNLHIHVGEPQKESSKTEPEQTPGKRPLLERIIGLS